MDPIIARLERLERDYRRSRTWNRVALLVLLVAVCAGSAQQQDPKLPEVIKCERIEASDGVFAKSVLTPVVRGATNFLNSPSFVLGESERGTILALASKNYSHHVRATAEDGEASLQLQQWDAEANVARGVYADASEQRGARLCVVTGGLQRAVLGATTTTDKLGRETRHPESTLMLIDKDGKLLEQLPR